VPGKYEDAARKVESEVKRLIKVMNDEVVPAVRKDSGKVLRRVAEQLHKLADSLDQNPPPASP
jgi:hypothetical protein